MPKWPCMRDEWRSPSLSRWPHGHLGGGPNGPEPANPVLAAVAASQGAVPSLHPEPRLSLQTGEPASFFVDHHKPISHRWGDLAPCSQPKPDVVLRDSFVLRGGKFHHPYPGLCRRLSRLACRFAVSDQPDRPRPHHRSCLNTRPVEAMHVGPTAGTGAPVILPLVLGNGGQRSANLRTRPRFSGRVVRALAAGLPGSL